MKAVFFVLILCVVILPRVSSQTKFPQNQEDFYQRAMSQINHRYVKWIKTNAQKVENQDMSESDVKSMISKDKKLGNLQNGDIEAITFLVMMEAAKSTEKDLKAIMNNIKATNEKKKALREAIERLDKSRITVTRTQLDSVKILINKTPAKTIKKNEKRVYKSKTNTAPVIKAEVDATINKAKDNLDSISELGEMESLRLQNVMDRQSKMLTTLSNILKKISETQESIIQNLK